MRESVDPETTLDVSHLLDLLDILVPRQYSIASSPSRDSPRKGDDGLVSLQLCVAIKQGTTPFRRRFIGVSSRHFRDMVPRAAPVSEGDDGGDIDDLRMWIRRGSFARIPLNCGSSFSATADKQVPGRPSAEIGRPVLFVGAGTGIAPLRGISRERLWVQEGESATDDAMIVTANDTAAAALSGKEGVPMSDLNQSTTVNSDVVPPPGHDNILVFGCRKKDTDFVYRDEWTSLSSFSPTSLRVLTAFSQDQSHKLYVQKVLREADSRSLIAEHILVRQGAVCIAGGTRVAQAVKEEIVEALAERVEGGKKEAVRIVNLLKRKGLIAIEAWS